MTSSNYDDTEEKVTGGRNGFGAKLANIFSTEFIIESGDSARKKTYKQSFFDNMSRRGDPKIRDEKTKDFTCITFKPDLKKFHMEKLDDDIVALFTKRVYDLAGITDRKVSVYLND